MLAVTTLGKKKCLDEENILKIVCILEAIKEKFYLNPKYSFCLPVLLSFMSFYLNFKFYCNHYFYSKQFQGPVLKLKGSCHRPVLVIKHAYFYVLPNALCHGFSNAVKWESSLGIYSSCLMSREVFPLVLLSLSATKQQVRSSTAPLFSATSAADKILNPSIPSHE